MKTKKGWKRCKETVALDEVEKQAFDKEQLTIAQILEYPTTIDDCILDTNASNSHIGETLTQIQNGEIFLLSIHKRSSRMRNLNII